MTVYLVGAGPGDPELLTMRAHRLLAEAEVVVFDRLVSSAILALAPQARLIDVGKTPGGPRRAQGDINQTLIDEGRGSATVVRIKGGDPYLFGRGGEEALALRNAGVAVEIVPGISSALAAPAAAGIPVTHRTLSTGVTIVTGSTADDTSGVDWAALAALDHTLVVLMGVRPAAEWSAQLIEAGRSPSEPVAVVGSATTDRQRVVRSTLEHIAGVDVPAPATIVVGPVAALADLPVWVTSAAVSAVPSAVPTAVPSAVPTAVPSVVNPPGPREAPVSDH